MRTYVCPLKSETIVYDLISGSTIGRCAKCFKEIWMSPTTLSDHEKMVICRHCVGNESLQFMTTDEQRKELAKEGIHFNFREFEAFIKEQGSLQEALKKLY